MRLDLAKPYHASSFRYKIPEPLDTYVKIWMGYGGIPLPLGGDTGKRPLIKWKGLKPEDGYEAVIRHRSACIGMTVPKGFIVVDNDSIRPDKNEFGNVLNKYLASVGLASLPFNSPRVITATGGEHYFLSVPKDVRVLKNLGEEFKYLDFLSHGCYFVLPGSTRNDRGEYKLDYGSFEVIPEAPIAFIEPIKKRAVIKEDVKGAKDFLDDEIGERMFNHFLKGRTLQEGERNNGVFNIASKARDFALSERKCLELIHPWNLENCYPPLEYEELETCVYSAYRSAKQPLGHEHPRVQFAGQSMVTGSDGKPRQIAAVKKSGVLPMCLNNGVLYLSQIEDIENKLRFNVLEDRVTVHGPLPWDRNITQGEIESVKEWGYRLWTHDDSIRLERTLGVMFGFFCVGKVSGFEIARSFARDACVYNPVVDRIDAVEWDGEHRIKTFFQDYYEAKETSDAYMALVSNIMFKSFIARVYSEDPVKVDTMVILEGPQGTKKSTFCELLGFKKFHKPFSGRVTSTHDVACLHGGTIIVEVDELAAMNRSDVESFKAFLSRDRDYIRRLYVNEHEMKARHFIFIGTHNPEGDGRYLKDKTGNRRYLPMRVGRFDSEKFLENRDQILAEARHRVFELGELWYPKDDIEVLLCKRAQRKREEVDNLEERLEEFLLNRMQNLGSNTEPFSGYVLQSEILDYLRLTADVRKMSRKRLDNLMNKLGWIVCDESGSHLRDNVTIGVRRQRRNSYWHKDYYHIKTRTKRESSDE